MDSPSLSLTAFCCGPGSLTFFRLVYAHGCDSRASRGSPGSASGPGPRRAGSPSRSPRRTPGSSRRVARSAPRGGDPFLHRRREDLAPRVPNLLGYAFFLRLRPLQVLHLYYLLRAFAPSLVQSVLPTLL